MEVIRVTQGALEENNMTEVSTTIVFDLRSREMGAFTASITQLPSGKLVIRKATELGCLKDFPDGELELPVLLLGAYSAQSSAGFSGAIAPEYYAGKYVLAGGCGLGWGQADPTTEKRKGDALRPLTNKQGEEFPLLYIPEPTLRKIKGASNSNVATADAAVAGFRLLARMRKEVLIEEGQSDYADAWSLRPKLGEGFRPEFPAEHRPDIFREAVASPEEKGPPPIVNPNDEFVEVDESAA